MEIFIIVIGSIFIFIWFLWHSFYIPNKKDRGWTIEYRPELERYYPKYNGLYIRYWCSLMEYQTENAIGLSEYEETEEEARQLIKKVRNYWGQSDNCIIIKY